MSADASSSRAVPSDEPPGDLDRSIQDLQRLARATAVPRAFYSELLETAVRALEAIGGAIWLDNAQGGLQLEYQINLAATQAVATPEHQAYHGMLLTTAFESGDLRIVSPKAGLPGPAQAANPTDLLLIVAPLYRDDETVGVLELFFPPDAPSAVQQGRAESIARLCDTSKDFHRHRELDELRRRAELWSQFEQFARRVHANLDVRSTAYQIANDGRLVIGCDRLSVAVRRGRRCRLKAISGLDRFSRRSAHVRGLQRLIDRVVKTGEPLVYVDDMDDLPPQLEAPLERFLDEMHVRQLLVVPLYEEDLEESSRKRPHVIGAIAAECFEADPNPEALKQRAMTVARHGQAALGNAMTYESVPLLPLLRLFGTFLGFRRVSLALLLLSLLAAAAAALVFVPAELTIEARGELQPRQRSDIFAPHEGIVTAVHVKHGQRVQRADPGHGDQGLLAELQSTTLEYEASKLLGDIRKAEQRRRTVGVLVLQFRNPRTTEEVQQRDKLIAEGEELEKTLASLREQLAILQRQQREMSIYSPIDGDVLTWNVEQELDRLPVRQGQLLMRIADLQGPWVLEIFVPDHHMGHVLAAAKERDEPLTVSFVLATAPEKSYTGRIEKVAMTTEPHEVHGPSVLVTIDVGPETREQIPDLRPGATVIGRIECGQRSLGYVWFHDLIDAVYTWVSF